MGVECNLKGKEKEMLLGIVSGFALGIGAGLIGDAPGKRMGYIIWGLGIYLAVVAAVAQYA